jgi:hypothetical protein
MTSAEERADQLREFVDSKPAVTFTDITKQFDWAKGDEPFWFSKNVLLWVSVSQELIDAIQTLCNENRIWPEPCDVFGYVMEGQSLKLPIANLMGTYDKPHWLPMDFRTEPPV